jgi:hypothetical protein
VKTIVSKLTEHGHDAVIEDVNADGEVDVTVNGHKVTFHHVSPDDEDTGRIIKELNYFTVDDGDDYTAIAGVHAGAASEGILSAIGSK